MTAPIEKASRQWTNIITTDEYMTPIINVMEGKPWDGGDVPPFTPLHFAQCVELLHEKPSYRQRLDEVVERHPAWVGVVREWDRLLELYNTCARAEKERATQPDAIAYREAIKRAREGISSDTGGGGGRVVT